ncbi:MAG TPA: exodeoxyribonuclease III [Burkholderiales bacterium]|nr:exodeoxyribonuclease III [Burkholderiales bacterium]
MKIAAWNVNSLKVRLPHVLQWLENRQPDVLCLQEIKCEDDKFPRGELESTGYHLAYCGQKTYNGVAILSRHPMSNIVPGIAGFEDEQKRVLSATIGGIRVICIYVPNGQSVGSEKYEYKMRWLKALSAGLRSELSRNPRIVVLGDFNIAPEDCDVHDPKLWEGQIHVSEAERAAFRDLLQLGFKDSFRLFPQQEKAYSWWDYRMNQFKRNMGLRIDHVLLSDALSSLCMGSYIDAEPRRLERPSDHAPVWVELQIDS